MARIAASDVQPGNPVLSGFSVAYMQDVGMVGQELFKPMAVDKDAGAFYKWGARSFLSREDVLRAEGGKYYRSNPSLSQVTFSTQERGHEAPLDDDVRNNADSQLSLDKEFSGYATSKVALQFEKDAATLAQTSGSYASTVTLSGTSQWSNLTASNPIGDVETGKETIRAKVGRYPDTIVMNAAVRSKLVQHSQIIGRLTNVQRTGTGDISDSLLASIFGVNRILIAQPIEITSAEGQTDTYADLWNDNVILAITDEPRQRGRNFGITWSRYGTGIWVTDTYREEAIRSNIYRTRAKYDQDVVSSISGYLIIDALA